MEYIPYVGFATSNRATVMIYLCLYKKKKKKVRHNMRRNVIRSIVFFGYTWQTAQ